MKVAQATCGLILAYQISVFLVDVDQLSRSGSFQIFKKLAVNSMTFVFELNGFKET